MPKIKPAVDSCLDWIEMTSLTQAKDENVLRERAARVTGTIPGDWRPDQAFNRYSTCLRHVGGSQALCGRSDMGTHIIIGGQALTAFRKEGREAAGLLSGMIEGGYHPTRLDLAIDAINSRIDGLSTLTDFQTGKGKTRATLVNMLISKNDGWTIYIGSRTSDKHLRIYNKNAEIDNKALIPEGVEDWVRIELVCRDTNSRAAASLIRDHGVATAARSMIRAYADNPSDPKWAKVMAGPITQVGKSVRKITNTRQWLMQVAARTLAREELADPSTYEEFLGNVNLWRAVLTKRRMVNESVDNQPDVDLQ